MNNLSEQMKDRLEKWRQKTISAASAEKVRGNTTTRRFGKGDYGDALTLDEWEEEARKSQTRR